MIRSEIARRRFVAEVIFGDAFWVCGRPRVEVGLPGREPVRTVESSLFWPESIAVLEIEVVVSRDIAGLFGSLDFLVKLAYHNFLNHFAALGIDRVGDIGIELGAAVGVFRSA